MTDERVTIRAITDVAGLRAIEALQLAVWGMPERDVVPLHHLLASSSAGGVVLGAFTDGGRLIGFCYGFAGVREGTPLFYSHMAGVLPEFRGRGVGFALKRAQRAAALARGFPRMVWTYDPLQSANAYLNLHKLGAEARRYYVNYYGEMADELNRGDQSDRLEVDWWLRDPRVDALMRGDPAPPSTDDVLRRGRAATPAVPLGPDAARRHAAAPPADEVRRIDIPTDITALRRADREAAGRWREATRAQFLRAFASGYVAADVERGPDRCAYLLVPRPERPR